MGNGPICLKYNAAGWHNSFAASFTENAPGFCRSLISLVERGDELALHGYHHADDSPRRLTHEITSMHRIYTWEGEFHWPGLAPAAERLDAGHHQVLCGRALA